MKLHRAFLGLIAASVLVTGTNLAVAQEEITKDEWEWQIQENTRMRDELKTTLDKLNADIAAMKGVSAQRDQEIGKCEDELYALVGATRSQVEEYRRRVNALESNANGLTRLSNQDLWDRRGDIDVNQSELNELRKSKISLLTEFWDKLGATQQKIDALKRTLDSIAAMMEKTYTVGTWSRDRDCLWNIARKKTIYDSAFMWPKIWQGNRDKIRDPDLIYPGQKLRIPAVAPMTREERAAANNYYRKKAG